MASSTPHGSVDPLTGKDPAKALTAVASGFFENVKKNKQSFFQFFAMTGILLLSFRSVSQKYRIHDLEEDTAILKKERDSLNDRMSKIKSDLMHQASIDSTGVFASRLRLLFADDDKNLTARNFYTVENEKPIDDYNYKCDLQFAARFRKPNRDIELSRTLEKIKSNKD